MLLQLSGCRDQTFFSGEIHLGSSKIEHSVILHSHIIGVPNQSALIRLIGYINLESLGFAHQWFIPSRLCHTLAGCPYRDEPSYFCGAPCTVGLHTSTVWLAFIYIATSPISISEIYAGVMMKLQIKAICSIFFFSVEKPTVHLYFDMLKRMISVF